MKYIHIENGEAMIRIVPKGLPHFFGVIPAPLMTEIARAKIVQNAVNKKYLKGFWIEIKGRVRNPAFDTRDEKTTTRIVYRPCKNEDEAHFVLGKIKEIVENGAI